VIGFPNTSISTKKSKQLKRNLFFKHKEEIREKIDRVMIERVAPAGTIIESLFVEQDRGKSLLLRPLGTYPLQCQMATSDATIETKLDVVVTQHGPRSLTVLPYPLPVNDMSLAQWRAIPGFGSKLAARIKSEERIVAEEHLEQIIEKELPSWIKHKLSFS
jgi:radical SAM superfamily enzyme with C-terminal helix-hairpin-helix motif